jgi:hypothetical protein
MTLSTLTSRANYPGAGLTGPFAFPFRIFAAADLLVTKRSALGVETPLAYVTNYSVAGVGDAAGSVTLTTALAVGEFISIRRAPTLDQPVSIRNNSAYFASVHEDEFDRLVMQMQDLKDQVARAPKVMESYDPAAYNMIAIKPVANQVLAWDATGTKIEARSVSDGATTLPGNGRTVATLTDYLANNVTANPLDWGADGTGVADSSAAVQSCVTFCLSVDPPVTMTVSGLLRLASSVNIDRVIDAYSSSTWFRIIQNGVRSGLLVTNPSNTMFSSTLGGAGVPGTQGIQFDGVTFRSSVPSNPSYVIDGPKYCRTMFRGCSFHAIKVLTTAYYLQSIYMDGCKVYGWLGTFFNGTNGSYDVKLNQIMAEAGGTFLNLTNPAGLHGADPNCGFSMTNSLIESMSSDAIVMDRIAQASFDNVYFEGNVGADIKMDTAENLTTAAQNNSVKVTGCFHSLTTANRLDATYFCIRWGNVDNGIAMGNKQYGGLTRQLHKRIAGSNVTIIEDTDWPSINGSPERLRTIRGTVAAVGTITVGSGFTITKVGTGQYTINFTTPFGAVPTVVLAPGDTLGENMSALTGAVTSSAAGVAIRRTTHAFADCIFNFIATGPA